jgi:hypothetical protein
MSTMQVPERSYEQRITALSKANRLRIYRARLKREMKAGRTTLYEIMCDPDCATMKVYEAMLAQPKVGRIKANKALRRAAISPNKTLGGLTERQRLAILQELPRG